MTTTRKLVKGNDEFDTGSESESEIMKSNDSPVKSTKSQLFDTKNYSPSRYTYSSPASDAADRLNQIRSRLSLGASTSTICSFG